MPLKVDSLIATTINVTEYLQNGLPITVGAGCTPITYAELQNLISLSTLNCGVHYLITDYRTCYRRPNYNKYKQPFGDSNDLYVAEAIDPIVVLAVSNNTLASDAYQPSYPNDTIKYDINNNSFLSGPEYGRITERIDEFGNRTDYDHRTIQFKRYRLRTYNRYNPQQGTVELQSDGTVLGTSTSFTSLSPGQVIAIRNSNETFYEIVSITDNFTMTVTGETISATGGGGFQFFNSDDWNYDSYYPNNVDGQNDFQLYKTFFDAIDNDGCVNTYVGDQFRYHLEYNYGDFFLANNVFKDGQYENNTIGDSSYNNTFNDDCTANKIGFGFRNNITDDDFDSNVIGNFFNNNIITTNFIHNQIGINFEDNVILCSEFWRNQIGNDFRDNWLDGDWGFDFQNNQIGNQFNNNEIYKAFYKNVILNGYNNNQTWDEVQGNKIGNGFNGNDIYTQFQDNIINEYFENNTIGDPLNIGSGNFYDNIIGNNFDNNTITGNCYENKIANNFNSNTIANDFRYNQISYTVSSTDFSSATHVYNNYNCRIIKSDDNSLYLEYLSVTTPTYVSITA